MTTRPHSLTRRRVVAVAAVAVGGLWSGLSPAGAATAAGSRFSAADRALVLRLARIGAVFPVPFPAFGEDGSARARVSDRRLRGALGATKPARVARALRAVKTLRAGGADLLDDQALLLRFADLARAADRSTEDLVAMTAIGIAAVSNHFDPNSDSAARFWIDGLARMRAAGNLGAGLQRAGVR